MMKNDLFEKIFIMMVDRVFYKIPSGGISQIDALEAGKSTYEDSSLLVVRKCVKLTFVHHIRW